jgi:hypothetical protein
MTDTNDLIARLAKETKPDKPALRPGQIATRLLVVLIAYAIGAQFLIGFRPDLISKLTGFWYEAEITTLWLLIITSVLAGIASMSPDNFQRPNLLKLPYMVFGILLLIIAYQYFMPLVPHTDAGFETKGMECAICLAALSIVPSALMFAYLRKGATVHPYQTGAFAVFTATGIGCITLRLAEANDSMMHLAIWHYLPTLLFAIIGAFLGKWLLKW